VRKLKRSDLAILRLLIKHQGHTALSAGGLLYTKRYRLCQVLSPLTRHILLMTATPHNGKEADF